MSGLWIGCILFSVGAGAAECGRAIRDARRGELPLSNVKERLARRLKLASCLAILSVLAGLEAPAAPPEGWKLVGFLGLCALGFGLLIALVRLVKADLRETEKLAQEEARKLASTLTGSDTSGRAGKEGEESSSPPSHSS